MRALVLLGVALAAAVLSAEEISLGAYSYSARLKLEERIRQALTGDLDVGTVSGTVTVAADRAFFIQGKEESLKVVLEKGRLPTSGDVVEAKGRPSLEGGRVVFAAESWRKCGSSDLPKPRTVDSTDLLFVGDSESARKIDINWLLVEVKGRAMALTESGFAIDVDGLPVTVAMDRLPDFLSDCERMHPLVTVRGVAELILDQSVLFRKTRQVMGVKLTALDERSVTLVPDLAYLVNRRDRRVMALVVVVIALLVLGLVLLILHSLRQGRRQLRTRTLMDERKRMADDLHDTIEQHLVGAGMLIQLQRNKEARDVLAQAKREMRDIIWGLKNDDMMRLTPVEMIKELARQETRKGLYRVTARLEGLPSKMEASKMRDLSLIVREAIGNAVKHGGAKKIAISSDPKGEDGWLLRIANDGRSFDEATAPGVKEGHFGLEGMRQRARRLGAQVSFSVKGEWTVVSIER